MRIRYLMLLSMMIAVLSPHASGSVGVTNIVQLHAPLLLHSDGSAYTPSDVTILRQEFQSAIAHTDGSANLRVATGQLAQCGGRDCTPQPLGFEPGIALPTSGTMRSAELDLFKMDTLMSADAHQYTRSDFFLEDEGDGAPYGSFSSARGSLHMRFQIAESDSMTLAFGVQQYLSAFYDADTLRGSYVEAQTQFGFELYDSTASQSVMLYKPSALNYTIRLDGEGPLEIVQDGGMQYFSVGSGQLQAGHTYELGIHQMTYSRGMIASAVPEPSTMLMYLAGLACLFVPAARRRLPKGRVLMAWLLLVGPAAAWASDGTQALAGIEIHGPRLLHSDGTRYEWSDFTSRAPISPYATAWTEANGREDISGTNSFSNSARQFMNSCTGTDCTGSAFPGRLDGDTANVSFQGWQMADFVAQDSSQLTQVNASAVTQPSRAEIRTHTEMWNFGVLAADSMTIEFDARAFGQLEGDASARVDFRAWIADNWSGNKVSLVPDGLSFELHAGDADYDSGLQTFSFNLPLVGPGPGYFLVFEQTLIASAVPETAPAAMYGVGMAGLLALARQRRNVAPSVG